jgi:fatty-acyl-CoA synthase
MTDAGHMPQTSLRNVLCFEDLVQAESDDFEWVKVDENDACGLCYTSGTTGNPKGVLYSHRANVIHALVTTSGDAFGLRSVDSVLPVVPMFHANAWSLAFSAPLTGAKLVMPGAKMDGASIYELLENEGVTFTAAVPTVWLMLLNYLESERKKLTTLKRVAIGGSACPRSMIEKFEESYGVNVMHAWGMTEMSPLGTIGSLKAGMDRLPHEERIRQKLKQGRPPFTVEMKITDDAGKELPRRRFGHLKVRGPPSWGVFQSGGGNILDETVVRHGRRVDPGSSRLHADHRPGQGRHQVRRRMDFVDRSGKCRCRSPVGWRSRRHWRSAPEMGRTSAADRRA